jgi:hypothetical protein
MFGFAGFESTATRAIFGKVSFRSAESLAGQFAGEKADPVVMP